MTILRASHLNTEEYATQESIAKDYRDIFYIEGDNLSFAHEVKRLSHMQCANPNTSVAAPCEAGILDTLTSEHS